MFRIIKALNNNSILVLSNETKREYILMGSGIGFGKMPGQQIESMKGAKVYSLVTRKKKQSALKAVNSIDPVYLEISGEIIDLAEEEFSQVNRDILLAMADHIALATKRAKENMQFPNPFTKDIQMLFSREFQVALKGREIIKAKTGYVISDDEAGLIALHIHAGLSDEMVSETLETTRIIEECISIIEEHFQMKIPKDSLAYARMMSHLYYMAARARKEEPLKVDMNDYIYEKYPRTGKAAELVCAHMGKELKKEIREGVKFSVSMGKIFFDKNQICIIVLSKFLVFCCRIIYLIIVLPIRLRLYMNFIIFCSTNNGISNPFSWALPTPGLGNKLGFSGNTINAEGIR